MAIYEPAIIKRNLSGKRLRRSLPLTILLFVAVTLASYVADLSNRPITSALVYVIGVMVIGASRGRRSGLVAAVAASLIYSLVIKNPALEFQEIDAEYYVPLIAFNITALLSGTLAGRLKDRAETAENARNQLDLLLKFSSELQKALRLDQVTAALQTVVSGQVVRDRLIPYVDAQPSRSASLGRVLDDAARAVDAPSKGHRQFDTGEVDLAALADLLAMAAERCDLLARQAESEAIERSEHLKTAILSSLSHDLRTPIAAISASAASLRRFGDALSPDVRADMLATIEDQCARLDRFTAKLLSFGRLQGGVGASQLEAVDVVELLGNAIGSARLSGPDHVVEKALPDRVPAVMANPAMLEQVFFNILENAVDYTPAGSKIFIRLHADEQTLTISFRDNGGGVSAENIGRIFEPFFRSERSRHTNGQGLGLFIAKGFVEAFGGRIAAVSPHAAGQGLEISIALPLAPVHREGHADG